ncbi:MAG: hypothetical protein ABI402_06520 [Ferruginibacter sp.]
MKKLFVPVIFLLLGFMISQSACHDKTKGETAQDNTNGDTNNHDSLPCNVCGDYSKLSPFQGLAVNLLLDMTDRYRKNISIPTSLTFKGTNQDDAHSVWLDLDSLKRFIWEVESRSCGVNCKDSKAKLGIRIYYGRYPATGVNAGTNTDLSVLSEEYENRHTVFMVPTYSFNGNEPTDYNAFDTFNIKKCTYPEIFAGDTMLVLSGGLTGRQTAQNHGGLCPPLCPSVAATRFGQ